MTSLPSGLASISSRLDDSPQVRGAVDMAMRLRQARARLIMDDMDASLNELEAARKTLTSAIDRHAALVIGSAYRSADRR